MQETFQATGGRTIRRDDRAGASAGTRRRARIQVAPIYGTARSGWAVLMVWFAMLAAVGALLITL